MIAIAKSSPTTSGTKSQTADNQTGGHGQFLALLPAIGRHARRGFRHRGADAHDEAVNAVIAHDQPR